MVPRGARNGGGRISDYLHLSLTCDVRNFGLDGVGWADPWNTSGRPLSERSSFDKTLQTFSTDEEVHESVVVFRRFLYLLIPLYCSGFLVY